MLEDALGVFRLVGGKWTFVNAYCPGNPVPVVTPALVRQQVLRLLPHVGVGVAWKARALTNAETVLWAQTGVNRSLGTVTVVGQQVALRIGFDHADWDFGDGSTDSTSTPGKAYSSADPCTTAQCSDYYGHTYTATGDRTITLRVSWHAEFSLDGGATWTDVDPAALPGPAATHDLTVDQARAVLVPDP